VAGFRFTPETPDKVFKYDKVTEHIEARYRAGAFRGELPVTINDLARDLAVNPRTVVKGLDPFVRRKLLRTVKSRGIVEVRRSPVWVEAGVGLILQVDDHYYGRLAGAIAALLNEQGIAPLFINRKTVEANASPEAYLEPFLARRVSAFVIDGSGYCIHPYMTGLAEATHVTFAHVFEGADIPPGAAVLVDFATGIELATQHLLKLGHRRICLAINQPNGNLFAHPLLLARSRHGQCAAGYERAMREAGAEQHVHTFWDRCPGPDDPGRRWQELMLQPERPTAFVCASDAGAATILNWATELGLRVPDDLALTGCYNTPWAEMSPVKLTSLDLDIDEQAHLIVKTILAPAGQARQYLVTPRLVVRASSGARR
jgi:LacI family transcriptional regulator